MLMGIYEKAPLNLGKILAYKKVILIILAVIVIALLAYAILTSFQPTPIKASFSKNPVSITEGQTVLSVIVTNTTGAGAGEIFVDVRPVDIKTLTITPQRQTITMLGEGENRKLEYNVSVNKTETIYPGNYTITVKAIINQQTFEQAFTLTLVE